MTLDDWLKTTRATLVDFEIATRARLATDPTWPSDIDEASWWRDVAAFTILRSVDVEPEDGTEPR